MTELNDEMGLNPAKITDRFLAYLIDTFPFGIGYYVSLYWLMARGYLPVVPQSGTRMLIVWIGLYVAYHAVFNMMGGTIGKRMMGICVVDDQGEPLRLGKSLIRALGLLVSTPFFNLGFLWSFVNRDSLTWHDLLAGSYVVETHPKTARESLIHALVAFALLLAMLALSFRFYLLQPTPADVAAIQKARQGLQVLAQIEEKYKFQHGTYTDRLVDLAVASGNPEGFGISMRGLFDPHGFRISADKNRFRFQARAKDRRKTVISLSSR